MIEAVAGYGRRVQPNRGTLEVVDQSEYRGACASQDVCDKPVFEHVSGLLPEVTTLLALYYHDGHCD